ncbi:MAG: M23 family metallopeptidase [Candidatus Woesearchaeota archaeon]|nr:MAG: M23 family metallopeptidase [Candidatus Woesearchaeota archaeon]
MGLELRKIISYLIAIIVLLVLVFYPGKAIAEPIKNFFLDKKSSECDAFGSFGADAQELLGKDYCVPKDCSKEGVVCTDEERKAFEEYLKKLKDLCASDAADDKDKKEDACKKYGELTQANAVKVSGEEALLMCPSLPSVSGTSLGLSSGADSRLKAALEKITNSALYASGQQTIVERMIAQGGDLNPYFQFIVMTMKSGGDYMAVNGNEKGLFLISEEIAKEVGYDVSAASDPRLNAYSSVDMFVKYVSKIKNAENDCDRVAAFFGGPGVLEESSICKGKKIYQCESEESYANVRAKVTEYKRLVQSLLSSSSSSSSETQEAPQTTKAYLSSRTIIITSCLYRNDGAGTEYHGATDFVISPSKSKVFAIVGGTVYKAQNNGQGYTGYGNFVHIEGDDGYDYLYAHLTQDSVDVGQRVEFGEELGIQGTTGTSEASYPEHLHIGKIKHGDDFIKDNGYGLPVTNQIISAYSAMGIKKIYFKESTCYESYKVDTIAQYNQQINSLFS